VPVVTAAALSAWSQKALVAAGVRSEHAALVADSLVAANLRGVDSHGIHLLASYLDQIAAGDGDW
jgi:LDH2 family malate/lactate/ureidoglycolate dehydrogenase